MPLYEYQCGACGHRFETIQKFSDPPLTECPKCGGAVRKLQSAPAFQFKGSGWYITDYARKDQGASKPDQDKSEVSSQKSEVKPEASNEKSKVSSQKSESQKSEASPAKSDASKS